MGGNNVNPRAPNSPILTAVSRHPNGLLRKKDSMGISNRTSRPISAAEGRARKKHVAPVWEGAEYHRYPPGIYDVRCIHIQGPEWLRSHRRWSLRLECMFLDEPDARVSGFLSLGNDPERPRVGRKSRYFDLWCKTNRGLPRKGQAMRWEDFLDRFYRVRIADGVTDAKGGEIPEDQRYSKIVEFLECISP